MRTICFDDGPTELTERILDTLAEAEVSAIFAVVGDRAMERPETVRRIIREGHEIANHTMTHAKLTTLAWDEAITEVWECEKLLRSITGIRPTKLRPPFVLCNEQVKAVARHFKYELLVASSMGDYKFDDPEALAWAAAPFTDFLGLHDNHETTADALPRILELL